MLHYKVGLPLSPYSMKFGYEVPERKTLESGRSIAVVLGEINLKLEANKYNIEGLTNLTLLNYRDYFFYKAAQALILNTQYSTLDKTELTNKAQQAWRSVSFDGMWPYVGPDISNLGTNPKYWGQLGSLAYYSKYVDHSLLLPSIIEETLRFIWCICGTTYENLPDSRLLSVVKDVGFTKELAEVIEESSRGLFSLDSGSEDYFLLTFARRRAIIPTTFDNLFLKVLLGEYSSEIFNVVTPLLSTLQQTKVQKALYNVNQLLLPSGFILLLQALICEAYLKAGLYITSLDQSLYNISLQQIEASKQYTEIGYQISRFLCLAFDSYSALSKYSTFKYAQYEATSLKSDIYSWLTLAKSTISDKDDYRLYSFI